MQKQFKYGIVQENHKQQQNWISMFIVHCKLFSLPFQFKFFICNTQLLRLKLILLLQVFATLPFIFKQQGVNYRFKMLMLRMNASLAENVLGKFCTFMLINQPIADFKNALIFVNKKLIKKQLMHEILLTQKLISSRW